MSSITARVSVAILATVSGGLILAGCGGSEQSAPATQSAPTQATVPQAPIIESSTPTRAPASTPTTTAQPPQPTTATLGPNGYGKVALGMSFADVKAAGFVRDGQPAGQGCVQYDMYTNGKRDGFVHISAARGVEAISPNLPVRTAEGVELGWKAAKVKTVYSTIDLADVEHLGRVIPQVPGNSAAVYRIGFRDEAVDSLALQFSDQTCYE